MSIARLSTVFNDHLTTACKLSVTGTFCIVSALLTSPQPGETPDAKEPQREGVEDIAGTIIEEEQHKIRDARERDSEDSHPGQYAAAILLFALRHEGSSLRR